VSALAPDVVHLEGLLPRGVRALAGTLPAVPILAQDHATRCPRGWRRWWYRRAFAPLAGVAFADRSQAAPFLAAGVLRPGIRVFELLADSSWFTPGDQAGARRATGLFGDPCLLWLGRLDANKDPLTVLDAFARAIPALRDPHLWCCFGTPSPLETAVVRRVAEDRALAARVHIMGARPHADVEPLLRAADFFVQGSHHEAMGVAAIEALACGTTPLVTAIPSFERITAGGAVGGLAKPGDAASMATHLVAWAQRDRGALRRQARAHFERALSFDVIGAQLRAVYDTLRTPR
jgi:glycosyltransferase involved in cell wall biosynthesis